MEPARFFDLYNMRKRIQTLEALATKSTAARQLFDDLKAELAKFEACWQTRDNRQDTIDSPTEVDTDDVNESEFLEEMSKLMGSARTGHEAGLGQKRAHTRKQLKAVSRDQALLDQLETDMEVYSGTFGRISGVAERPAGSSGISRMARHSGSEYLNPTLLPSAAATASSTVSGHQGPKRLPTFKTMSSKVWREPRQSLERGSGSAIDGVPMTAAVPALGVLRSGAGSGDGSPRESALKAQHAARSSRLSSPMQTVSLGGRADAVARAR